MSRIGSSSQRDEQDLRASGTTPGAGRCLVEHPDPDSALRTVASTEAQA